MPWAFGMMEVDGHIFRKDLMIFPDGSIDHPWWKVSGHVLTIADIQPILASHPAILVVGTGDSGMMKSNAQFVQELEAKGIQAIILPTTQTVQEFNRLSTKAEPYAGCFHLTC